MALMFDTVGLFQCKDVALLYKNFHYEVHVKKVFILK